ncbi:hypothetical protein SLI_1066 [Streptomyces lividans 1326]|uniref:Uncharacterized protein n=1 Tax=Streptomyces lividans 1326 TaxID=1200984 RepID=A0A7U9H9K6_STRLI|nr:hypothetical protein SLI_1066 [Streptomyces lividans 1326]
MVMVGTRSEPPGEVREDHVLGLADDQSRPYPHSSPPVARAVAVFSGVGSWGTFAGDATFFSTCT